MTAAAAIEGKFKCPPERGKTETSPW